MFVNCVRILEEEKLRLLHVFVILRKKMKEIGMLIQSVKKTVPALESIAAVSESMREAPTKSFRRCVQQLNISDTSLPRILHKYVSMTPYKVH